MTSSDPPQNARWARVTDLFHRALDLAPDARSGFLDEECASDPVLRTEVASLLAAHTRAEDFIEHPPAPLPDDIMSGAEPEPFAPDTTIGRYRILRTLGVGGMGVVYLAEDTTLGRTVALKALPARFTSDETKRERLKREARAAAALNHPGIATIYALEEIEDQLYIASEFVPGETLRDSLRDEPLGPRAAVNVIRDITDALAAAHRAGIVHRDLKPENVIVTPTGVIKILDFGLARFVDPAASEVQLTQEGLPLGTPAYMSPEQIRGAAIDARSDVFSLGILLFELATGTHPFAGSTDSSMIARILENPHRRLADALPPGGLDQDYDDQWLQGLDEIVATCLQKAPAARFASADDLSRALTVIDTPQLPPPVRQLRAARPATAPPSAPVLWWWQFHQGATTVSYVLLLIPLWSIRTLAAGPRGNALFVVGLLAVVVSATLRLHLWFTARHYRSEWDIQRRQSAIWIRLADWLLVVVLAGAGGLALGSEPRLASLLVAAAMAVLVSFSVIEPATTRVAFDRR